MVSTVDRTVQEFLIQNIHTLPGEQNILAEENQQQTNETQAEHLWIIDPINGTANFLKQSKDYGVMVAYFQHGDPKLSYLYDVVNDQLTVAKENVGVFMNAQKLNPPPALTIEDSFVSIDPRKTFQQNVFRKAAEQSFDLRFLGSTIADCLRVINGQFGASLNSSSEPWERAPLILFAQELGLEMK